jgi:hypothetical protein
MKLKTSLFGNDHLQVSRWELVKLFFGFKLHDGTNKSPGALNVSVSPPKSKETS